MGIKSKPGANADTWLSVGIMGCFKEDVRNKIPEEFSWTPCSTGDGASQPLQPHLLCFQSIFFRQNHFDSSCVSGHKQPSIKKHFEVESRLGTPQDGSCVFLLCCTLKVGRESSNIDTKTCWKRNKLHSFPLPSPRPKLSIQNSPCGRWEQREQRLLQPKFKAFHPILVPCPLPMTSVLGELRCMTTLRLWGVSARALRNGLFLEYICLYSQ